MSIAVYAGGRSNGSPSPEAKPDLNGATLMLALLALKTPDPYEMFVVRMLRDRPHTCTFGRGPCRSRQREWIARARGVIWWVSYSHVVTQGRRRHSGDKCRIVNVAEVGEVVSKRQARGRGTRDWNGWA